MRKLLLTLLILTLFISISYSQLLVKIVSPKNGETVSGNVTINVEVSDPTNVSKVEFYINNVKVGEDTESPYQYSWNTIQYENGTHTITAKAYDYARNMRSASIIVNVQNIYQNVWEKTYGGSGDDRAYSIQQTKDGGYIVAGMTNSFGAGRSDVYIIKLDVNGNKLWQKTFGGSGNDGAYSIQQTKDGGYIIAGYTESFGKGESDVYVIKLDANGNKVWEKTFGGRYDDGAYSIQQTTDGGYIIAGWTSSFGAGNSHVYVIKLNADGGEEWEKIYGGNDYDEAYSIQQTSDGGCIVAGVTSSFGAGQYDFYVIKLNENGDKVWEKTFGGNDYDEAYSIQQTSDGGCIVAGVTSSFGAGQYDFYVIKLNANGDKLWEKIYGGSSWDEAYSIQQTQDGGYIVAGRTGSFGAGGWDVYVIKMDIDGNTGLYPTK
jgi:uncharacterized delta-60 repeat protein